MRTREIMEVVSITRGGYYVKDMKTTGFIRKSSLLTNTKYDTYVEAYLQAIIRRHTVLTELYLQSRGVPEVYWDYFRDNNLLGKKLDTLAFKDPIDPKDDYHIMATMYLKRVIEVNT